ncbi:MULTISPECIES: hypothetical protein [Streptomyces]|uniref:hypothetical protein n=1 Tax=Streptomyces TaxID=1883 RepID=UPI0018E01FC9|nr:MULTISPECIES: hypothetical protein [Streptomyces]MCZ4124857.1 hypothetical protein [Streptomyces sp. H39-S7]
MDRIELALDLLGDRSCARTSTILGQSEHTVSARLSSGLWVLLAPCGCRAVRGV